MDKTWINLRSRASEEYIRGVTNFLNFSFERTEDGKIWCPCVNCVNTYRVSRRDAFDHLICDGFLKGYVRWIFHGERCDGSLPQTPTNVEEREFEHDIHNILHDMMTERVMNNDERHAQSVDPSTKLGEHNHRLQGDKFYGLLKASEKRKRVSRLVLDEQGLAQAHRYVLFNSDEVSPYIKKQEQEIKRRNRRKRFSPFEIHKLQSETFNTWFRDYDERQPGWLTVKHAKLRDLFDMGDASSFEKDGEPEQLGLDDSVDTSISSWIRNDVGADGFDVTQDMENENVEEDPINEQNREAIF
ncbi:hypothetical protein V6N12_012348 [Hibiscus sabdariffa]|uniref:Transposase-associated domain-containing protein n=1 Tax=Hibiscus sabdariffa TaxID=183260 RepID=A0ABR2CI92_9ROSI